MVTTTSYTTSHSHSEDTWKNMEALLEMIKVDAGVRQTDGQTGRQAQLKTKDRSYSSSSWIDKMRLSRHLRQIRRGVASDSINT